LLRFQLLDDGGARRNRTDDLFNAIEALSQLSYGPIFHVPRGSLRLGEAPDRSRGRRYNRKASPATRPIAKKSGACRKTVASGDQRVPRRRQAQPSSSGAMSPSIKLLTSSSSSSSSSRKESSSSAASSSTSMSSTTVSATFSSPASTSSSDTMSTPAGATIWVSSSSSFVAARARIAAPWKTVPHFGQTIGSLLRSKNLAPHAWHWRLVPSSGLANGIGSLSFRWLFSEAPVSHVGEPCQCVSAAVDRGSTRCYERSPRERRSRHLAGFARVRLPVPCPCPN